MAYNLFLDDFRHPYDAFLMNHNTVYSQCDWVIVRDYKHFIKYIKKNGLPEMVSFDHDLADVHYNYGNIPYEEYTEKTGFHCAKWLINYCIDNNKELPKTILIHSANPVGKQNIQSLFDSYIKSLDLP